jgi:3-phosphoshikimate 1-carboxyvinyltransferase
MGAGSSRIVLPAAASALRGVVTVPSDKSIGHRAIILGAIARGTTTVRRFQGGDDNRSTIAVFRRLGVRIAEPSEGTLVIEGVGLRGLSEPMQVLDCGNSGTTMRLVAGVLAGQRFESVLDGDASLRRRPMRRVAEPLRKMGATVETAPGGTAPLRIRGATLHALAFELQQASAQVKSCLLLAGLYSEGEVRVREPGPSRDHTERMIEAFGTRIERDGGWLVSPRGAELIGTTIELPGDPSSAAFVLAAGLLCRDARVTVEGVCLNPTRTGIFDLWRAMGADLEIVETGMVGAEPVGRVTARSSAFRATEARGEVVVRAIDEIPVFALTAARADGVTRIRDAAELRTKESDRLAAIARELRKLGARVVEHPDGLDIEGTPHFRAASFESDGDHRMAMLAAIASLCAQGPCSIDETASIATSFPGFFSLVESLRA